MNADESEGEIRRVAKMLDDAVEEHDVQTVLSCFADECTIEFPGVVLQGKVGLEKSLGWLYRELGEIRFEPLVIMVDGNVFFEEFVLESRRGDEQTLRIKAAEVLVYQDYKVTHLRFYFDRLALARALAHGFVERWLVSGVERASLRGFPLPGG